MLYKDIFFYRELIATASFDKEVRVWSHEDNSEEEDDDNSDDMINDLSNQSSLQRGYENSSILNIAGNSINFDEKVTRNPKCKDEINSSVSCEIVLQGHTAAVTCVRPWNGSRNNCLLSASLDCSARIWDIIMGKLNKG